MRESKIGLTKRLQATHLWDEASQYRDEVRRKLRAEGLPRKEAAEKAWEATAEKYPPPPVPSTPPGRRPAAGTSRATEPDGGVAAAGPTERPALDLPGIRECLLILVEDAVLGVMERHNIPLPDRVLRELMAEISGHVSGLLHLEAEEEPEADPEDDPEADAEEDDDEISLAGSRSSSFPS